MKVPLGSQALTAFATSALRSMAEVLMAGELIRSHLIETREAMLALALGKLAFLMTQDLPRNVSLLCLFLSDKDRGKALGALSLADGAVDLAACTDDLPPAVIEGLLEASTKFADTSRVHRA